MDSELAVWQLCKLPPKLALDSMCDSAGADPSYCPARQPGFLLSAARACCARAVCASVWRKPSYRHQTGCFGRHFLRHDLQQEGGARASPGLGKLGS